MLSTTRQRMAIHRTRGIVSLMLVVFGIAAHGTPLRAQTLAQSGPQKVSLLEIYSSEGCSSCPPAEEWASRLTENPGLWKEFVPVIFHVDYCDHLGWKDKFSRKQFSDRQRVYDSFWETNSVYTPGFVLNGKEWRGWYQHDLTGLSSQKEVGDLLIEPVGDDRFKIVFQPKKKNMTKPSYTAHAALLGFNLVSDVKSGENAGRRLKHDFTVVDYMEKGMSPGENNKFEAELALKAPQNFSSVKLAISAWISEESSLEPLQAAGAYL